MRVLVCGSRDYTDFDYISKVLSEIDRITDLAHGDARGADRLAGAWAGRHPSIAVYPYPANWKGLGRGAGPARNNQMLKEFRPDLVIAFKDGFDHTLSRGGTEHMVKIARAAGIRTIVHDSGTRTTQ